MKLMDLKMIALSCAIVLGLAASHYRQHQSEFRTTASAPEMSYLATIQNDLHDPDAAPAQIIQVNMVMNRDVMVIVVMPVQQGPAIAGPDATTSFPGTRIWLGSGVAIGIRCVWARCVRYGDRGGFQI